MIVGRRMTRNPITARPDTPVTEAQALMRREKVHRLPVVDRHGKLVGIVSEKDLLYASPSPASTLDVYELSYLLSKLKVEQVMTKNVVTITTDTPVEEAARVMADNDIGGVPILEDGHLVGIITESDVFKLFIELFGTRRSGIRATLLVPEQRGELAQLSSAIADRGGNIISMGTFLGEDDRNALVVLKVEGVGPEELVEAVKPSVLEVVDVREI
jgi:acetoin utilization protein AcuB